MLAVASLLTAGLHILSPSTLDARATCHASRPQLRLRCPPLLLKQATAPRGFGAKAKKRKPSKVVQLDKSISDALEKLAEGEPSLERYMNPALFEDPETMQGIARKLQAEEVVVIRDAFRPEFAEMVHAELASKDVAWELNEAYFPDGYGHRHWNVYDRDLWSARLNATLDVFASQVSQRFVESLTGRDCSGVTTGAPSWYQEGDHSLPHTDWVGQRTVAFVWHLSKNWKPEWGGVRRCASHAPRPMLHAPCSTPHAPCPMSPCNSSSSGGSARRAARPPVCQAS